jgi:hypothetical protein
MVVDIMFNWAQRSAKHKTTWDGVELPDIELFIVDPDYFHHLYSNIIIGYVRGHSSRIAPCPVWERMADPTASSRVAGASAPLPLSKGVRAFAELNWILRTSACVNFAILLSTSG